MKPFCLRISLPDPNVVGESAPQYSFPRARNNHLADSSPEVGPGSYYSQPSAVLHAAPAYSIGTSARVDPKVVQKQDLPGPGAYPDTDLVRSHVQGGQFGRESRFGLTPVPEESLGPGEYDAEFEDLPEPKGPSFPKASRGPSVNSDVHLGPGTYDHPDTFKSNIEKNKGFSLSGKLNLPDPDPCLATPGPLDYRPAPAGMNRVRGGKFGKDERASSSESRKTSHSPSPGPGRYTPQKEKLTPHAPEYSFGGASRNRPLQSDAKAATIYDIRAAPGLELPSFSMGKRLNPASSATKIPGPGAYEPSALDKVRFPITVFGKEDQRPSTASTAATRDLPAPGEYNPNLSLIKPSLYSNSKSSKTSHSIDFDFSLPKIGFGKSAQRILPTQAGNPSPVDYNIESEFTRNKQARKGATLSSRFKTRSDIEETPGPGEYFQGSLNPIRPRPSSVRIGKEKRGFAVKPGTEVPGPGEYSSKPGIFELVKMQARQRPSGTNLTKETRFKTGNPFDASPGPGTYAIANSIGSGTAWVMGSKLNQKNPHGRPSTQPC